MRLPSLFGSDFRRMPLEWWTVLCYAERSEKAAQQGDDALDKLLAMTAGLFARQSSDY